MKKILTESIMNKPMGKSTVGEMLPFLLLISIIILILIFCIRMVFKTSKARSINKVKKSAVKADGASVVCTFLHINGLPIAENAVCQLISYPDRYDFISGNMNFSLAKNKVTDVCCKTETEIKKQYVSSIGGAVGGAVLFGPLGAIIGGRAKKKTDKTVHLCLIITYMTDNEVKYIGLENMGMSNGINKVIDEFKKNHVTQTNIEL